MPRISWAGRKRPVPTCCAPTAIRVHCAPAARRHDAARCGDEGGCGVELHSEVPRSPWNFSSHRRSAARRGGADHHGRSDAAIRGGAGDRWRWLGHAAIQPDPHDVRGHGDGQLKSRGRGCGRDGTGRSLWSALGGRRGADPASRAILLRRGHRHRDPRRATGHHLRRTGSCPAYRRAGRPSHLRHDPRIGAGTHPHVVAQRLAPVRGGHAQAWLPACHHAGINLRQHRPELVVYGLGNVGHMEGGGHRAIHDHRPTIHVASLPRGRAAYTRAATLLSGSAPRRRRGDYTPPRAPRSTS